MAIKHKHMSETVDDMTTGWRRILIGSGFFCLSVDNARDFAQIG